MDRIARMVERRPLVMFSRSNCAMCHSILTLMRGFGANLTVYEVDQLGQNGREIEAALLQMGCRPAGVPAVYIGQQFVGGADAVMSLHLQSRLVPMLISAGAIFMWHEQQNRH